MDKTCAQGVRGAAREEERLRSSNSRSSRRALSPPPLPQRQPADLTRWIQGTGRGEDPAHSPKWAGNGQGDCRPQSPRAETAALYMAPMACGGPGMGAEAVWAPGWKRVGVNGGGSQRCRGQGPAEPPGRPREPVTQHTPPIPARTERGGGDRRTSAPGPSVLRSACSQSALAALGTVTRTQ